MFKKHQIYFISIAAFAIANNLFAPSITTLAGEFGRNPEDMDWLFVMTSCGFFCAMILCTILSERIGKETLITLGLGIFFLSYFALSFSSLIVVFVIFGLIIGCGGAFVEISATSSLSDKAIKGNHLRLMNFSQVFYCAGAIGTPFLVGILLDNGVQWRNIFRGAAIMALVVAIFMSRKIRRTKPEHKEHPHLLAFIEFLKKPAFLILFLEMFLYGCAESSYSKWTCAYFEKVLGAPLWVSGIMLSVFWGGVCAGRVLFSFYDFKISERKIILLFNLIAIAGAIPVVLTKDYRLVSVFVFIVGFGCSVIWPTVLAILGKRFPENSGAAFSMCIGAGALGCVFGPLIVGRATALSGSFRVGMTMPVLLFIISLALSFKTSQRKSVIIQ